MARSARIYGYPSREPCVRCRWCGETRILAGMIGPHLRDIGHPPTFDFSNPAYRALLGALTIRKVA